MRDYVKFLIKNSMVERPGNRVRAKLLVTKEATPNWYIPLMVYGIYD